MNHATVSAVSFSTFSGRNAMTALALVASVAAALLTGCAGDAASEDEPRAESPLADGEERTASDTLKPSKAVDLVKRHATPRLGVKPSLTERDDVRGDLEGGRCPTSMVLEGDRCFPLCPTGTVASGSVCWELCPATHPTACGDVCSADIECPVRHPLENLANPPKATR